VMPDLAYTMKSNPKMKVMLAGGYFDLATPYFEGKFEMHHLQIPQKLQSKFHADVAAFIRGTEDGK
jgi:carboxypeptidase C (cathepsin A)